MARPRSPLSKFVLSLPRDLSAKEVIARAKARGMQTSEHNVYRIRGMLNAKVAKTPGTEAPASKPSPPSKSEFIRRQPASASAKDVVAKGRAAGLKFDAEYVYKIRRVAKAKAGAVRGSEKAGPVNTKKERGEGIRAASRKGPAVTRPISTTSSVEALLRAIAAEVGLGRAIEILAGERVRVRAVLGV